MKPEFRFIFEKLWLVIVVICVHDDYVTPGTWVVAGVAVRSLALSAIYARS